MLPSERHSPFAAHEFVANLMLLFSEHPLLERPAVAKAAGFDRVEFWWPYGKDPDPRPDLIDAFVSSVQRSGVQVVAMNLFAGDMQNGERGVLSYPEHTAEFRRSVDIGMEIGERLGIRLFNAPYGHRLRVRRAWVRGTMLPGIVSAWTGVDGTVPGVPYIVFAGNVGNDDALAHVVNVLRAEP